MSHAFQIAVCASGGGGNFQALIDQQDAVGYKIAQFIADRDCGAIDRANRHAIPCLKLDSVGRDRLSDEIDAGLTPDVDLIVLAGFMPILSASLCRKWVGKIINTHPSLLPKFGGKGMHGVRVQEAVLAAGEANAGCTVHYVNEEIDGGAIILQRAIPVVTGESAWDLGGRVFREENLLLVQAVQLIISQRGY